MKWLFFGVLGLAPGHCSEKCEILQVRRDDQSRYHNLKPPSSLGSGWNEIHCPPADLVQIRNIQRPTIEVLHLYRCSTHTPGRSRVNPERQEEEKANKNSAGGGGERTDLQNQPTRRDGPDQNRAHT